MNASISVIIPAKDPGQLLARALLSVIPQLTEIDEVIVVDDGSDQWPLLQSHPQVRIIALEASVGPYNARNIAAQTAVGTHLVFFDIRCVASTGWLEAHRTMLSRGVSYSYTSVVVEPGDSPAGRAVAAREPFSIRNYRGSGYFPTCNLGVPANYFEQVGGFSNVRSGGDAQLCWALSRATKRPPAVDDTSYVTWTPRQTTAAAFAQFRRYGAAHHKLSRPSLFALIVRLALLLPRVAKRVYEAWRRFPAQPTVYRAAAGVQIAFEVGVLTGRPGARASALPRGLARIFGEKS